jgi:hypothetical protein
MKQIRGAERWILDYPDRLFLDRQCEFPFPFSLPSREEASVHRIVVASGAADRCREALGGAGSLMLRLEHKGVDDPPPPFTLVHTIREPGFTHVFDEVTLGIVLETLDTISDFVAYLEAKENLARRGSVVMAAGEEEILARYLKHADGKGKRGFGLSDKFDVALIEEGGWKALLTNPQWLAKLEADKVSYAWDALIEKFAHYAATGEAELREGMGIADFERALRFLARESRVKRRSLADAILGIMQQARPGTERASRVVFPAEPGDPFYAFLALHKPEGIGHEKYRVKRREMLYALCLATRSRWPEARDVVGVATEPLSAKSRSEDLLYLDGSVWDSAMEEEAEAARAQFGLFNSLRMKQRHYSEYPVGPPGHREPVRRRELDTGRNDPCPCRSGRKFKRCCGRPSS